MTEGESTDHFQLLHSRLIVKCKQLAGFNESVTKATTGGGIRRLSETATDRRQSLPPLNSHSTRMKTRRRCAHRREAFMDSKAIILDSSRHLWNLVRQIERTRSRSGRFTPSPIIFHSKSRAFAHDIRQCNGPLAGHLGDRPFCQIDGTLLVPNLPTSSYVISAKRCQGTWMMDHLRHGPREFQFRVHAWGYLQLHR